MLIQPERAHNHSSQPKHRTAVERARLDNRRRRRRRGYGNVSLCVLRESAEAANKRGRDRAGVGGKKRGPNEPGAFGSPREMKSKRGCAEGKAEPIPQKPSQ